VIEEIADDAAQHTSPLPPSPIIPPTSPHQSPRTSPSQTTEGTSILVQQVLDKYSALVHRPVVDAVSTLVNAAKPKVLKVVPAAPT
nr:hypothetical protein [Tanacetum cinerariifolium]